MRQCQCLLCRKVTKKLHKIVDNVNKMHVALLGGPKLQVDCSYETYVVDLEEHTCACMKWELTGLPCMHVVAVIQECQNQLEDFVHNCYTIETDMNCYNNILNPINGRMLWPEMDEPRIIQPTWTVPQRGKKQKKR